MTVRLFTGIRPLEAFDRSSVFRLFSNEGFSSERRFYTEAHVPHWLVKGGSRP
jgi:hypothetical protein